MYTREQYADGIRLAESLNACEGNLKKAKEFFAANDFEALHRIVVYNQEWLRELGVISELLSGTGQTWHDNGQLRVHGTYVNGNHHGVWEWFYDNGQLESRATLVNGKRHGVWEWFYKNGKLFERNTFEHGEIIKTETF